MSLTKKSGEPGPEKGAREAGLDSLTSTDLSECAGAKAEEGAGGYRCFLRRKVGVSCAGSRRHHSDPPSPWIPASTSVTITMPSVE